ncbi:hypothetical protein LXL04_016322 [Taraxacum kok-saghyz]
MTQCINRGDPCFHHWIWDPDKQQGFSVNSLRKLLDTGLLQESQSSTIWYRLVPIKTNIFIWRARLDRLPTRFNLEKRGMVLQSPNCHWCHTSVETAQHTFVDCRTTNTTRKRAFNDTQCVSSRGQMTHKYNK